MKKLFNKTLAIAMCIAMLASTLAFSGSAKFDKSDFIPDKDVVESMIDKVFGKKDEISIGLNSVDVVLNGAEDEVVYYEYGDGTCSLVSVPVSTSGVFKVPSKSPEGSTVTEIDYMAFCGSKVTKIVIPATVEYIAESSFVACTELKEIEVEAGNPNYKSSNGMLFSKDMKELVFVPAKLFGAEFAIPEGVEYLSEVALCEGKDYVLTIPSSLTVSGIYESSLTIIANEFKVSDKNKELFVRDGVLYGKDDDIIAIIKYPVCSDKDIFVFDNDVNLCSEYAFMSSNIAAVLPFESDRVPYTGESPYVIPEDLTILINEECLDSFDSESMLMAAHHIGFILTDEEYIDAANELADELNAEFSLLKEKIEDALDEVLDEIEYGSEEYYMYMMMIEMYSHMYNTHFLKITSQKVAGCYDGYSKFECFCGFKCTHYVPALGHDFGEWKTDGNGFTHSCLACGEYTEKFALKAPSTTVVRYGDTLILNLDNEEVYGDDVTVVWEVNGAGATINASEDGLSCAVTCTDKGTATVTAKLVWNNSDDEIVQGEKGDKVVVSQELTMNGGFFWKIISFFKDLFNISRIIPQ